MSPSDVSKHPRALAYLGDALYELWVRQLAIEHTDNLERLHQFTTQRVNAGIQADLLTHIEPMLSEEEKAIAKRARNLPVTAHKRGNQTTHRRATAFEALIGHWHLTDLNREDTVKSVILNLLQTASFLEIK